MKCLSLQARKLSLTLSCFFLITAVSPASFCFALPTVIYDTPLSIDEQVQQGFDSDFFLEQIVSSEDRRLTEALSFANKGNYLECVQLVEQYLAENPDSAPGYEILGSVLALSGKEDEGLAQLQKAVAIDPKQSSAYTKIGDILLAREDLAGARDVFQAAIDINAMDRRAHQRLGLLFEKEGKTETAINHYEKGIIGTRPDYVGVKVNLGRLYNERREFANTQALLENLLPPESKNVTGHIVLGTAYLSLGQHDNALSHFQRAANVDPARGLIPLGISYRTKGRFEDSLDALKEARGISPDNGIVYYQLAETFFVLKKFLEAEDMYQESVRHGYDQLASLRGVIRSQLAGNNLDAAILTLEKIGESSEAVLSDHVELSDAYKLKGAHQQAEDVLVNLQKIYPENPIVPYKLGLLYGYIKRYQDAIEALKKALVLTKEDDVIVLKTLAVAYAQSGERGKAIQTAEKIYAIQPEDIVSVFYLASLYQDDSNFAEAEKLYEEIIMMQPNHAFSLNNLAVVMLEKEDYRKALELSMKAVSLAPENVFIIDTLGWSQVKAGQYAEALETLQKANKQIPNVPVVLYHIGEAYDAMGDKQAALEYFTKALSFSSDFTGADTAKAKLQ